MCRIGIGARSRRAALDLDDQVLSSDVVPVGFRRTAAREAIPAATNKSTMPATRSASLERTSAGWLVAIAWRCSSRSAADSAAERPESSVAASSTLDWEVSDAGFTADPELTVLEEDRDDIGHTIMTRTPATRDSSDPPASSGVPRHSRRPGPGAGTATPPSTRRRRVRCAGPGATFGVRARASSVGGEYHVV